MLSLLWILACGSPGDAVPDPVGEPLAAAVYSAGMWGERVLTVTAGLDEALATLAGGDPQAAAALSAAVYRGSFEPELEPLIRAQLGRSAAATAEYGFGLVGQALTDGDALLATERRDALVVRLTGLAESLDAAQAVLGD